MLIGPPRQRGVLRRRQEIGQHGPLPTPAAAQTVACPIPGPINRRLRSKVVSRSCWKGGRPAPERVSRHHNRKASAEHPDKTWEGGTDVLIQRGARSRRRRG